MIREDATTWKGDITGHLSCARLFENENSTYENLREKKRKASYLI